MFCRESGSRAHEPPARVVEGVGGLRRPLAPRPRLNPHVRRLGAQLRVHVEVAPLRRGGGRSLRPQLR